MFQYLWTQNSNSFWKNQNGNHFEQQANEKVLYKMYDFFHEYHIDLNNLSFDNWLKKTLHSKNSKFQGVLKLKIR